MPARALVAALFLGGSACSIIGPPALRQSRLQYNETVKVTSEQEMLLNIVRLRYADTPSSLAISNIAAQFELAASAGATPFFAAGADQPFGTVLPQVGVGGADRPTFSLTPLDDSNFVRRLFTPLSLDGAVYLARTTWPIQTVFRLYLENLNWVPNAQSASGPTPAQAPPPSGFREGIAALQALQDRGDVVFGHEERVEAIGGPVPASSITAEAAIQAVQQGCELVPSSDGKTWQLQKRARHYVMHLNPKAAGLAETKAFLSAFRLTPGREKYDVTVDESPPFSGEEQLARVDLETRSLLQALYFVAHGVEVPPEHLEKGLARTTRSTDGKPFDWRVHLEGLFRVRSLPGSCDSDPREAHVAIEFNEHCFFIEGSDQDTKATFALLMELSRLELPDQASKAPLLTIPLGR
ncbi:MAG: hypothetical protein AMXMBFR34_47640 [Myxococcaceae bacterium]